MTIDEVSRGFEGRMDELLERLTISELMFPIGVSQDQDMRINIKKIADLQKDQLEEVPVVPVTDTLLYCYDFGDDWNVKITVTECYYTLDSFDIVEEGKMDGYICAGSAETFLETVKAYDRNNQIQNEEMRDKIVEATYRLRPSCLSLDGLCLMDDVGGVHGYADFIRTIKLGEPEERESMLSWAKWMGWTGRMPKPSSLL